MSASTRFFPILILRYRASWQMLRWIRSSPADEQANQGPAVAPGGNAQLPLEILLAIFMPLCPVRDSREDVWFPVDGFYADGRHILVCAARVCRAWHIAAASVLYRVVRLDTGEACLAFARTVALQQHLAATVRTVAFPDFAAWFAQLDGARPGLRLRFRTYQTRLPLSRAVVAIIRSCTLATDFRLMFPDSFRVFNKSQLRTLAPRLTHLKLQQDPLPRGSVFGHRVDAIDRLVFPHLNVLRLSGPRMDVTSLLAASPNLRASFPSLGALFLTRIHIRAQILKGILVHLGPQLETLVFQSVIVRSASDYHGLGTAFGPMSLLNYDIIPDNFLPSLKDLRIPGIHYYFAKPPLSIRNFRSGLPKLTKLSLDVTFFFRLLDVVHVLTASLEQLTVYHWSKMAPSSRASDMGDMTDPWQTVQHLKMRLARFKPSAPRLRAILLRVSSAPIRALPDWRMLSFLLAGVLGNLDIQFQTEVHVNEPSVRLALHREHCIEAGLPITDADERLLHTDVTSSYFQRYRERI